MDVAAKQRETEGSRTNTLVGKVLSSPTGVGVQDLLVLAWDFDLERVAARFERQEVEIEKVQDGDIVRAMLRLMESSPVREQIFPQRLGSVLTRGDGSFVLSYEDDLFADPDIVDRRPATDRRPDLILLVLAPDKPSKSGSGLPLSERLLFYTRPIAFEAGRTESVVVRIDEDRLAEFGVHPRLESAGGDAPPTVFEARATREYQMAAARFAATANLIKSLELPRLQLERKTFDKLLPNLIQRPIGSLDGFIGFSPGRDKVISSIWQGFKGIKWLFDKSPPMTGRVYFGPKDLARLGLSAAAVAAGNGQAVSFDRLLSHLGFPNGLFRTRDLLTHIQARREVDALARKAEVAPGAAPAPGAAATTPDKLRAEIMKRLHEQVGGLARSPEVADPANDLARIRGIVDQLEQTSGFANAAATHDVDILQVAFEPVWTSAFNPSLSEKAKALYRQIALEDGTSIFNGVFPNLDDIESVDQLRSMLADIVSSAGASVKSVGPIMFGAAMGDNAAERLESAMSSLSALQGIGKLALELSNELSQPYSFEYFAAGSINYGILQTYRQSWTPVSYQVGRILDTIPLAAAETLSVKVTATMKRRNKVNGRELTAFKRTDEANVLSRTEIEAIDKTSLAMTSQVSANGSFNVGIGSIGGTTTFGLNQNQESQRVHKTFAEMARKSSQEVRRETELTYEIETSSESYAESTRTLRNANDEMTVTYLLYELERRFRVASELQAVQPVLLVALPMPAPNEIDDAWLLQHAWIIRDVLLEPRFEEALDILENSRSRDDAQLSILKVSYEAAMALRKKADAEFERLSQLAAARRNEVAQLGQGAAIADSEQADTAQRVIVALRTGGISELFGGGQSNEDDILRAKQEAVQKALDYLEKELSSAAEARDRAVAALNDATERYRTALVEKAMSDQKMLQLRLHVRGNIFHYLHEIWRRRDPDDVFFSLYDLDVPFLDPLPDQCKVRSPKPDEKDDEVPGVNINGDLYMVDVHPSYEVPDLAKLPKTRLIEVADVDRPLGFKGNYVIFPLKKGSLLTNYMTVGFLDGYFGIRDPSLNRSYNVADLIEYARSVWNDDVVKLSQDQKNQLQDLILASALRNTGYTAEVVLPTGKLWMEALKGGQALLEPFKLAHRALDVLKVEEEVRRERIDNLRRVQRVGLSKPELGDPDIEKVTFVQGLKGGVTIDPDG